MFAEGYVAWQVVLDIHFASVSTTPTCITTNSNHLVKSSWPQANGARSRLRKCSGTTRNNESCASAASPD